MKITAILPVSRPQYLDRVLESLKNQTLKPNNLLVVFDGHDSQFIEVRNKVAEQQYELVLCVKSCNDRMALSIPDRRVHIAAIHNQIKTIIGDTDWIFSIEDDGVLPPNALADLFRMTKTCKNLGIATGVELGRWGVKYVGAWRVNDVNDASELSSIDNRIAEAPLIEEIDACGLYCALIRADQYKEHTFTFRNGLGPDVNLGIFIRQRGYNNYVNWSIPVIHLNRVEGHEIEIHPSETAKSVKLRLLHGNIWQSYR